MYAYLLLCGISVFSYVWLVVSRISSVSHIPKELHKHSPTEVNRARSAIHSFHYIMRAT